jgi:type III restriction enzyme
VFGGFKKTWHPLNKFDSKTEKDFSIILEQDQKVLKWLRPAPTQFRIYWKHNSRQYHPDFVAETKEAIYMIETKKETDIETTDVQEKTTAALLYCKNASEFTTQNGGKPWKYVLIPHNAVMVNMSFGKLVRQFGVINS